MIEINFRDEITGFISDDDEDLLSLTWRPLPNKNTSYIVRGRPALYMHRVILERMLGIELDRHTHVDHINGNGLDNQRSNLRLATHSQNLHNSRRSANNTSGFKGVNFFKEKRRWRSFIQLNGKRKFLGYFDTPEQAHEAYCAAAKKYYGEFARFE